MASEQPKEIPIPTEHALNPAGGEESAQPSKEGAKKAEAKAKKDTEKAREATERETASSYAAAEVLAKDNYGSTHSV
jgi:aspartyl-tRNA synthetase